MAERPQSKTDEDKLFESIAMGLPYDQLCAQVAEYDLKLPSRIVRGSAKSRARGFQAEEQTQRALAVLPEVHDAIITPRLSYLDMKKIDMLLYMQPVEPIKTVAVQVKSSEDAIEQTLLDIQQANELTKSEMKYWLARRRLLFICGMDIPENIQSNFYRKYQTLKDTVKNITTGEIANHPSNPNNIVQLLKQKRKAVVYTERKFTQSDDGVTCEMEVKLYGGRKVIIQVKEATKGLSVREANQKLLDLLKQEGLI